MSRRFIALPLTLLSFGDAQNSPTESKPLIRQVDHVLIKVADPEPLFKLLSQTLELPVAWPLKSYGFFASGGVFAGNVNLEVLRMGPVAEKSRGNALVPRLYGIAFEPVDTIESSVRILDDRALTHGPALPMSGIRPNGEQGVLWTNVYLHDLNIPDTMMFLCQYSWDVEERRELLRAELRSRSEKTLGLLGVKEIVIGVTEFEQARRQWARHLHPIQPSADGVWPIGHGPAIRLVRDGKDRIRALVLRVSSLAHAKRFLARKGLLGASTPDKVSLAGAIVGELDIQLIE